MTDDGTDGEFTPAMTETNAGSKASGPLGRFLEVDSAVLDTLFAVGLLAICAVFAWLSIDYSKDARSVPLLVLVMIIVLLASVVAIQRSERIAAVANRLGESESLTDKLGATEGGAEVETNILTRRLSAIKILLWMVLLFASIYVAGHIAGIFVFLLLIYRVYAEQTLVRTIAYTLANTLFIYFVFRVALNARLYDGLLGLGF